VAVTDVIQLGILILGLILVLPFIFNQPGSMANAWTTYSNQWGSAASFLPSKSLLGTQYSLWWDSALLLVFGGIPWQVYFQRVLAAKSAKVAVRLSIFSGFVCLMAAIPAVLIGIGAYVTDWASLGLPPPPDAASVLPHAIRYLCSPFVATLGLGAVAAAVMSSADSSILAASSLTAWNIIPRFTRKKSTSLTHLIKRCVWVIGIAATLIALQVTSIYELWFLCSDLVYCLLFPALFTALFDPKANNRGALAGFLIALLLRSGGGEPVFHVPAWMPYPMDVDGIITLPFKTISMLAGLITIMVVSRVFPEGTRKNVLSGSINVP
jgi:high affinity choline transporter 7